MSFFKKILARIGIGSAHVDTRLVDDTVMPGDALSGEISILGGDVSQDIGNMYLTVLTQYKRESSDTTYFQECVLVKHLICESFTLQPQESRVKPFSLYLPYATPLTTIHGSSSVYLRTGLDIEHALDPEDTDYLLVQPHPLMVGVFNAVSNLGFQLFKVECVYSCSTLFPYPFVQEFVFHPHGTYRGRVHELEIIFKLNPDVLELFLGIDLHAQGWRGFLEKTFETNEHFAHMQISSDERTNLEPRLDALIQSRLV